MNLTKQGVGKLDSSGKSQRLVFDSHRDSPKGFGVRITKAGGKAYILQYSINGMQKRMTISPVQNIELSEARRKGRDLIAEIDSGTDPLLQKSLKRGEPLLKELIEDYSEILEGKVSESAIKGYFSRDLIPALGNLKVRDVRRRDIIKLIENKAKKTPTAARCLLAYTKGFFDWCVDREYIEFSPALIRPKSIRTNSIQVKARGRTLDNDEIRSLCKSELPLLPKLVLKLILITGQRPSEVAGMHLDEVKGDKWTIPASRRQKTNEENTVYLTDLAQGIIGEARAEVVRVGERRRRKPSGHIFETGFNNPIHVGDLSKVIKRYDVGNKNHSDWGNWTPHDLRRTCRTGLSECGVEQSIAERVIGHRPQGIIAVYDKASHYEGKTAALKKWGQRLLAILEDTPTDNVVPMRSVS